MSRSRVIPALTRLLLPVVASCLMTGNAFTASAEQPHPWLAGIVAMVEHDLPSVRAIVRQEIEMPELAMPVPPTHPAVDTPAPAHVPPPHPRIAQVAEHGQVHYTPLIDNDLVASVRIQALQRLGTFNIINVLQQCDVGCTQNTDVAANALSFAFQDIDADAVNAADIDTLSSMAGSGGWLRGLIVEGSAQTQIAAGQTLFTGNVIGLAQHAGSGSTQSASVAANAIGVGAQNVNGTAGNSLQLP